ncbi:hypothetical protein BDZ89DRAFT_1141435 [Hymenopellis radicata]|nr:hypothetical protein BDZ89DRAFT_1141435 [Hymenopellis radicata]
MMKATPSEGYSAHHSAPTFQSLYDRLTLSLQELESIDLSPHPDAVIRNQIAHCNGEALHQFFFERIRMLEQRLETQCPDLTAEQRAHKEARDALTAATAQLAQAEESVRVMRANSSDLERALADARAYSSQLEERLKQAAGADGRSLPQLAKQPHNQKQINALFTLSQSHQYGSQNSIAFFEEGTKLVVGTAAGKAQVFNVKSGTCLQELRIDGHRRAETVAIGSDEQSTLIAVATSDPIALNVLKIYQLTSGPTCRRWYIFAIIAAVLVILATSQLYRSGATASSPHDEPSTFLDPTYSQSALVIQYDPALDQYNLEDTDNDGDERDDANGEPSTFFDFTSQSVPFVVHDPALVQSNSEGSDNDKDERDDDDVDNEHDRQVNAPRRWTIIVQCPSDVQLAALSLSVTAALSFIKLSYVNRECERALRAVVLRKRARRNWGRIKRAAVSLDCPICFETIVSPKTCVINYPLSASLMFLQAEIVDTLIAPAAWNK